MKTFKDVKDKLQVGTKLKLVRHDWLHPTHIKLQVGMVREIIKKQSNAIQFAGGSWLYFPKASEIVVDGEKRQFSVVLNIEQAQFMTYEFVEE